MFAGWWWFVFSLLSVFSVCACVLVLSMLLCFLFSLCVRVFLCFQCFVLFVFSVYGSMVLNLQEQQMVMLVDRESNL